MTYFAPRPLDSVLLSSGKDTILVLLSYASSSFTLFLCTGFANPCPRCICDSWIYCAPLHGNCFSFFLLQEILGRPVKPWEGWVWVHFNAWSHCYRAFKGFILMMRSQWVITDAKELSVKWYCLYCFSCIACNEDVSLLPFPYSTLESLCSQRTCPDVWPTSAPAGLLCSWMVLVGTHPTSCLPRQGILFLQLLHLSQLQGILLPALSVTYCCAPSTGQWSMGSAASSR